MQQIREDIKKHSFHPVYLLYGEESYLVRQYRDQLKEAVLGDGDEMNYSYFQGAKVDLLQVRSMADTLPFFAEYRLIIWEDSRLFKSASDFSDYLEVMPPTTILVFVEKEIDKRNRLYKYVTKNGVVAQMSLMGVEDTKKYVGLKLYKGKKKIRESTVEYLLEQVDNSLTNLENELDKLIAYTGEREEVTTEDIDAVCSVQVTGQIFKMLDAVVSGHRKEAMTLYHDLLELKESPVSILYLLTRHFNILLQLKDGVSLSRGELAKQIGIPPFAVGKYQTQCKHFTKEKLLRMITACTETDFAFKQGKINDRIGVETLLVEFME